MLTSAQKPIRDSKYKQISFLILETWSKVPFFFFQEVEALSRIPQGTVPRLPPRTDLGDLNLT